MIAAGSEVATDGAVDAVDGRPEARRPTPPPEALKMGSTGTPVNESPSNRSSCSLVTSLFPTICRTRAEAFARRLHRRLTSLGAENPSQTWLHDSSIDPDDILDQQPRRSQENYSPNPKEDDLKNTKEDNIKNSKEYNLKNSEKQNYKNPEKRNYKNPKDYNLKYSGNYNFPNSENDNFPNSEEYNFKNSEKCNLKNPEKENLANSGKGNFRKVEEENSKNPKEENWKNPGNQSSKSPEKENFRSLEERNLKNPGEYNLTNLEEENCFMDPGDGLISPAEPATASEISGLLINSRILDDSDGMDSDAVFVSPRASPPSDCSEIYFDVSQSQDEKVESYFDFVTEKNEEESSSRESLWSTFEESSVSLEGEDEDEDECDEGGIEELRRRNDLSPAIKPPSNPPIKSNSTLNPEELLKLQINNQEPTKESKTNQKSTNEILQIPNKKSEQSNNTKINNIRISKIDKKETESNPISDPSNIKTETPNKQPKEKTKINNDSIPEINKEKPEESIKNETKIQIKNTNKSQSIINKEKSSESITNNEKSEESNKIKTNNNEILKNKNRNLIEKPETEINNPSIIEINNDEKSEESCLPFEEEEEKMSLLLEKLASSPKITEGRRISRDRDEEISEDNEEDGGGRIPKIRRSSSLKTGKTPPGTPGRKKIVRFADVLGLDLADVRTFLDEIPKVPNSAYRDLSYDEVFRKDGSPDTPRAPASAYNDFRKDTSPVNFAQRRKPDRTLVPLFEQPGGSPAFLELVKRRKVCLENVLVHDPVALSVRGTVRVVNLDFHKSVHVRYTLNRWANFSDLSASYVANSCDGFTDKFSFSLDCHTLPAGERLEFAVRYHCKGEQYWDNNEGENYCFQCLALVGKEQEGQKWFY